MSYCQGCADTQRELTEVRESYRDLKKAVLNALGADAPWAITTENQRSIVERIERLRALLEKATVRLEILRGRMEACDVENERGEAHALSRFEIDGWVEEQRSLLKKEGA